MDTKNQSQCMDKADALDILDRTIDFVRNCDNKASIFLGTFGAASIIETITYPLADMGFNVIQTIFEDLEPKRELKICTSNLPLYDKITRITGNIIDAVDQILPQIPAEFGFWGVPPNDLEILKLFPDTTHVYGWTRCVEAGTPADLDLEMYVDENVPTVFYAQAFCAKSQLAKYLADKYNGLYVDIDDYASNSISAKIEAFLRLS